MKINIQEEIQNMKVVYANDFDDGYHNMTAPVSSELEKEARRIRRRYRASQVVEYLNAKAVYEEYMETIYGMYPSKSIAKFSIDSGNFTGFVPPKPRMKKKKILEDIKNGNIGSRVNWKNTSMDKVKKFINENFDTDVGDVHLEGDLKKKDVKSLKLNFKAGSKVNRNQDKILESLAHVSDYEMMTQFMRRKIEEQQVDTVEEWDPFSAPLHKMMDSKFVEQIRNTEEDDEVIIYNNSKMTRRQAKQYQFYDKLTEAGFDGLKLMKLHGSKLSKSVKRMERLTKVARKKKKKTDKILMNNSGISGYKDFEAYENDMLNFTFRD